EPPSGFEPETYGLRRRKQHVPQGVASARHGFVARSGSTSAYGTRGTNDARNVPVDGVFCAEPVPVLATAAPPDRALLANLAPPPPAPLRHPRPPPRPPARPAPSRWSPGGARRRVGRSVGRSGVRGRRDPAGFAVDRRSAVPAGAWLGDRFQ